MKVIFKPVLFFSASILLLSACGPSRVGVRELPVGPHMVRPAPPYANAVWIDGEWRWRSGRYEYINPHYVNPRRGRAWVPGHWTTSRRGNVWVKGRWR